jgi:hypothetical protein
MQKALLLIVLYTSFYQTVCAQKDKVRYILDMYEYVQDNIKGGSYALVQNGTEQIPSSLSIAGWETFQGKERFYFSGKGSDKPSLRMIIIEGMYQKTKYYAEYLYDSEGNLLYYIERKNEESYKELKAYFEKDGAMIELWKDNKVFYSIVLEASVKVKSLLKDAKAYYDYFQNIEK